MAHWARRSRPPHILIASDQDHPARELHDVLTRHGYTVLRAYTGKAALGLAQTGRPDVIILDAALPDQTGFEVARILRDEGRASPSTPILALVGGAPGPEQHRAALRAGVWEFLAQPLDLDELLPSLDTYVLAKLDADRAAGAGLVDPATGLYSTSGLARRARELALQAFHHHAAIACVALAPEPGDPRAAEHMARVLRTSGRKSDAIGRLGSAEFAVVAPGADADGAVKLAERLSGVIGRAGPVRVRAGYDAVANVRYAPLEPKNLLARAATALRVARTHPEGSWIRPYETAT